MLKIMNRKIVEDIRKPVVVNSRIEHKYMAGVIGTCKCRRIVQRVDMVLVQWDGMSEAVWIPHAVVRNCESLNLA